MLKTLLLEARHLIGGEIGLAWLVTGSNQLSLQHIIGVTSAIPSRLQQLTLPAGGERTLIRRLRYLGHRSVLTGSLHIRGHLAGLVANCSQQRRSIQHADLETFKLLSHYAGLLMATHRVRLPYERAAGDPSLHTLSDFGLRPNILHLLSPFFSGITHYLNNNLAVIGGHLELVLNRGHDQPPDQHFSAALHRVHQAGDVIRDLRDLLSVPLGDRHGPIDLNQFIHDCVQLVRSSWFVDGTSQQSPIRLLVDLHPVPPLIGSPLDLKVALLLLLRHLVNAVQPCSALILRTWTTIQHGRQEVFLELADEPGGVHIGKQEGGLEPVFTNRPLIAPEAMPYFIEETVRCLGGRILLPRPTSGRMTLLIAFTLPQMSCHR